MNDELDDVEEGEEELEIINIKGDPNQKLLRLDKFLK